ncbi:hypothetical protein AMECASPLE_024821 [Ameca splendens]|uniref:Uncharacterized protein n=1 Tax=Ameca splendens TaxID=208324 RepID=A0ABV1A020_9TELE
MMVLKVSCLQVKQEVPPLQEEDEEEEVICIKEEPAEQQEVMATLLLDCQAEQGQAPESEAQRLVTESTRPSASQINPGSSFSTAGQCIYSSRPAPDTSYKPITEVNLLMFNNISFLSWKTSVEQRAGVTCRKIQCCLICPYDSAVPEKRHHQHEYE